MEAKKERLLSAEPSLDELHCRHHFRVLVGFELRALEVGFETVEKILELLSQRKEYSRKPCFSKKSTALSRPKVGFQSVSPIRFLSMSVSK